MLLADYLEMLQGKGRYVFTREEAIAFLKVTSNAFRFAALRLIKKKRLMRPMNGFYVIVPAEYRMVGSPPPTWYVDDLMKFSQQPYYVGLLSAAALHGAAHQQPQTFQVVTNKPIYALKAEQSGIEFFTKKNTALDNHQSVKTTTGYMQVSVPEITALDLVQYFKSVGYLNNIATVLSELHEKFDETRFSDLLEKNMIEPPYVQRLGYLLEHIEAKKEIILLLKQWLEKKEPRYVALRPDKPYHKSHKNIDWHLYINDKIEVDI